MSDDEMVRVRLVGGPMDGGELPVDRASLEEERPGFDFVPEDGSGAPEGLHRVLYTAAAGGPADVWHWRAWVP